MDTWEEMMKQSYYSPEILSKIVDYSNDYIKTGTLDVEDAYNFFIAAAHASDVCKTIKMEKVDFELLPYEDIESDISEAFRFWLFREMFNSEDKDGNLIQKEVINGPGGISGIPVNMEDIKEGKSQFEKKVGCFFLFYFWNIFIQKLADKYEMTLSIDSVMIPGAHSFEFSQLGINIRSKDDPDIKQYFDIMKFIYEDLEDIGSDDIYFAIKDALNSTGISELYVPSSGDYDESRFKTYKEELVKYIPSGNETRVSIPEGVRKIGDNIFKDIPGITTIDLPDSLERISGTALSDMPDLTEVNINHNLQYVSEFAFYNSKIVEECKDMLIIGGWLVKYNLNEEIIKIPENVIGICATAFDDTEKNAKEVILPPELKGIHNDTFACFTELEKINIPEGLEYIDNGAFSDCVKLKEIIMPDTVTSLAFAAFQGCYELKKVRLSDRITMIDSFTFVDCESLEDLHLPTELKSIEECTDDLNAFAGCVSLKKIVFPEHLEHIGACAFQDCEGLEEIVLPDSIRTIDSKAFAGCIKLEKVYLPDHEIEIAEDAFEGTKWEKKK